MQVITNPSALRESPKRVLSWLKKVTKLSLYGSETRICRSRKINLVVDQILERGIIVTPQKTSLAQDIGLARRGKMKAEDVLKLLEKHEEECTRRYADIQKQLDKLDTRLWGIAALIIAAAVVQKVF